ncbi:MAG: leucine-rich repeat domain-containing protein [Treponema sp.]|jgi:hypothetical protein|nr:leucine-rich repeat domain-containing protein [Treponema sp.]
MKKTGVFIGLLAVFLALAEGFSSCTSSGGAARTATAAAAEERAAPSNSYFTGDGGKGTRIAILSLRGDGLAENQGNLPEVARTRFIRNFTEYSAIAVTDKVALDSQATEVLASGLWDDDALDEMNLFHEAPPDYILSGSIIKTAAGYTMQIQVIESPGSITVASYAEPCTLMELSNFTSINRASLDLLQKMGVQLTDRAKAELAGAARAQTVAAQTADAMGYAADRGGRTAEAAIYYTQAAAIDPSMLQTAGRASTLTAQIASGSIGAGTRDLIQQRKDWIALLTETEETIYNLISSASENPPYALYYSNDIQWGDINYQTETRDARFETNLRGHIYWFDSVRIAAQSVYGAVYDGLNKTGHKDEWGLGNWPGSGVTRQNPFNASWRHDINVVFELVNDQGTAIGSQTYSRRAEYSPRRDGNQVSIAYNTDDFVTLTFNAVKAADISDGGMSIRVASVNGAQPEQTPFQITMIPDWEDNTYLVVENGILRGFRSGVDTGRYRNPLIIPATLWAEPVAAIGNKAFAEKQLSSVVIPYGVTTIGDNAFANNQLSSVVIPDSVTTIGNSAFAYNPLRDIVIGKGVTSIVDNAFYYNTKGGFYLAVSIPANVTFIPVSLSPEEKARYESSGRRVSGDPAVMAGSGSVYDRTLADLMLNGGNMYDNKYANGFMWYYERQGKKAGKYTYGAGLFLSWKYSAK